MSYTDEGNGIELNDAICQNIVACSVEHAGAHGIAFFHGTSHLVSGCRVFMSKGNGVHIEDCYEMNVSSSVIGWNYGHNVEMDHVVWATVSANELIDAGGRQEPRYGVYMHNGTKGCQISANAIFN